VRLSKEQIEKLSERIFLVVYHSGYIVVFPDEAPSYQKLKDDIFKVVESHFKEQQSFFVLAFRELRENAVDHDESFWSKQVELAEKIARSKGQTTLDTPEVFDLLGEKIQKRLWNLDVVDLLVSEKRVANLVAKGLKRFQRQNDQINELIEQMVSNTHPEVQPYSREWCLAFDEVFDRLEKQAKDKLEAERLPN
jgi:hypothetical protein